MKNFYILMCFVFMSSFALAQNASVSGTVTTDDGPSIGAVVKLDGTTKGAITDLDGNFILSDIPPGNYDLVISSIGYEDSVNAISLSPGQQLNLGSLSLGSGSLAISGVEIIADIAIDRKTPIAVSNIDGEYVEQRLGNQELGELLTVTPSVYASRQGGGAGDSRIVLRGFDQRNTVYMINGIPVNDMENGWVYWSNWAGLSDVMRTMQVQRGLGASLLANPSVGGTVNLITKTTDQKAGGHAYASIGNDLYRKYGATLSTGNINNWAITFSGSRTTGNGYVNGTFNDAYSYFGSISKKFDNMEFVLTGLGAPQRHGQRTFAESLTRYVPNQDGSDYSEFIKGEKAGDHDAYGTDGSIRWGSSWGPTDRAPILGSRENDYINERTNFYHKPQVSLNHYWDLSDKVYLATSVYGSWGRGGGTGPYGNIQTFRSAWRTNDQANVVDWNSVLNANAQVTNGIGDYSTGEDFYLLRASMNEHNWYGALSKGIISLTDELDLTVGVDWRTYEGLHYRKIVDLFGLNGFNETGFADYPDGRIVGVDSKIYGLDDENNKIDYDNDGLVDWIGGFSELEYSNDNMTATFGGAVSNKAYERIDRQNYAADNPLRTSDKYDFLGFTVKGGMSYNLNQNHTIFGNLGYLSVAPIFDVVYPNFNNVEVNPNADNEKTTAFEAGYRFNTSNFALSLNGYYTSWKDKSFWENFRDSDTGARLQGLYTNSDQNHVGGEVEFKWKTTDKIDFWGAGSLGNWTFDKDVPVTIFDEDFNKIDDGTAYISDLKVSDSPQSQFALGTNGKIGKGLGLDLTYRHFMDHYSRFDGDGRRDPANAGIDAVKLPNYGLLDLGASYSIPVNKSGNELYFRTNIFNVLDNLYISDAFDEVGGSLEDLNGYFGAGRTWTTQMGVRFGPAKKQVAEVNVPMPAPVLDADGDGVLDASDDCPNTPGTVKGCPDSDGDGVIDRNDECPNEAGLATNGGCPEMMEEAEVIIEEKVIEVEVNTDRDGDGVVDSKDNCPDVAGAITNFGCPAPAPAPVVVAPTRPSVEVVEKLNFIARSVFFKTNSDQLQNDSRSQLDAIAAIMRDYPNAYFVVEGHTDNTGNADYNKELSARRARSVVNYLTGKGIDASHLTSVGYGEESPIASNDTAEGRQQNRRVVIKVR